MPQALLLKWLEQASAARATRRSVPCDCSSATSDTLAQLRLRSATHNRNLFCKLTGTAKAFVTFSLIGRCYSYRTTSKHFATKLSSSHFLKAKQAPPHLTLARFYSFGHNNYLQIMLVAYLPLLLMAAMVVITIPTTIITKTNKISQFAFQLNFMLARFCICDFGTVCRNETLMGEFSNIPTTCIKMESPSTFLLEDLIE